VIPMLTLLLKLGSALKYVIILSCDNHFSVLSSFNTQIATLIFVFAAFSVEVAKPVWQFGTLQVSP